MIDAPTLPVGYLAEHEESNLPAGYAREPAVRMGVDRDWPGSQPRQDYRPGEKDLFDAVRSELDVPLQIAGITPSMPQVGHRDAVDYRRGLLRELAGKTSTHSALKTSKSPALQRPAVVDQFKNEIVNAVMNLPYAENRLARIDQTDRTGRVISSYVGPKSLWMAPYRAPALISADGVIVRGGDDAAHMRAFTRLPV
jgi:hypothetical protein